MDRRRYIYIQMVILIFTEYQAVTPCKVANISAQENFQLGKFMGKWYEIKYIPLTHIPGEVLWTDYQVTFTQESQNLVSMYDMGRPKRTDEFCKESKHYLHTTDVPGKLQHSRGINSTRSDRCVVLTDYNNYAVQYGCRELLPDGRCAPGGVDSWVWSRAWTLPVDTMVMIDDFLNTTLCINMTTYVPNVNEKECSPETSAADVNYLATSVIYLAITLSVVSIAFE
ncbi:unnamed protein product [Owenia fusiformis]|uniref:Uncharacterized protein n=1 Tax=Owenia fusiformis TaxID=6347 RepID=A0A8J1XQ47_OWEFU|nr:unnamed protein product [Owenia fusiformis]